MWFFSAGKRGRLVGVLAAIGAVAAIGGVTAPALAGPDPLAPRIDGSRPAASPTTATILQVFYTPPVLVRAGERVRIPVDASCTTAAGAVCDGRVTLAVLAGGSGWMSASAPADAFLRYDTTAAAARALAGRATSGFVSFAIVERGAAGASVSVGTPVAPLRFYVTRSLPTVRVPVLPFRRADRGRTILYLPWGTGPARAGVVLGSESLTLGPSSFAVGRGGDVYLLDGEQGRLAVFAGGRLRRSVPVGRVSPDADVAVTDAGDAYVSSSDGVGVGRTVVLRRIGRGMRIPTTATIAGHGIPERLAVAAGRPYVRQLPTDEWRSAQDPAAPLTVGRPLSDGSQLLSVVRGRTVRLGIVRGDRVTGAVELSFGCDLGELALAEPDGRGGYVVVVHVAQERPAPVDQYQVVHVVGDRVLATFAVARRDFAHAAASSRFRLAPDGSLYQLASSPDGVRVVRFDLGGVA